MHVSPEPSLTAILDQFRRAGFRSLTPLQQRLIPLVFRGKNAAIETTQGSGGTAAAVYTLIIGYRGRSPAPLGEGAAPLAVLLAADPDEASQAAREWARFAKVLGRAPSFSALGDSDDARREQRRLGAGAAVVAGTPGRIIDHLRRGSLRLEGMETLVVSLPEGEARESFVRDVQFVLEKCPARRQTVLLGRPPLAGQEELLALAHHPEVVAAADQAEQAGQPGAAPLREVLALEGAEREEVLARLLLALPAAPTLVLHGARTGGEKAARRLRDLFLRAESLPAGSGAAVRRRAIAALAAGTRDALLVPLPVPDDLDVDDAACVVWLDLPQPRDARRALPARGRLVVLVGVNQARDLARLQESIGVTMNTLEMPGDAEMIRGALDRIVDRMAEEDPAALSRLAAEVRKRVPLLHRTQLAAFLLKAQLPRLAARPAPREPAAGPAAAPQPVRERPVGRQGVREGEGAGRREGRGDGGARREGRVERPAGRPPSRETGGREAGSGFTQLFVSAGRNRRVFARDLTALFQERLGLTAAEIGAVRVFEKYSFVEVASARAAEAVQRLSGVELKGRQLNVEVAKRKEEKPAR
jgi:ATP-dependent RNA helicase DeaD